ncbi:ectoine synthase [Vibrio parahaemolyticus]|uniref:ectoine synthase n=1 Tax=Vibrio parahaemolyticus TaxID=670 RepID=UPI0015BA1BFC|nr:ectoine synthase [Vibrio parahaemolyticus]EGR1556291.1 ectoine synthase [Vibrio parahaemolyticus]MBE4325384.1 ectoine synthase [Vibrio parahaemolyticus]QLE27082.1 ectoine synthase [Vibrio parahaemolyticus]HCE1881175.1 ectoine synthase [Vibrio parahaemolyticus]HCE3646604.1 ectoine synthase [Vibrio parahaemolyticus]
MIVRTLDECRNSERRVVADNWESVRMLLKDDNMGFSFHITTIYEGTETHIHYQNHLESVFCMSGEGEIEVVGGETYPIKPGTLYILDKHDEHYLRAYKNQEMVMACVFNPPITGAEVHDENGVYPLVD